jgi:hypothetical protein
MNCTFPEIDIKKLVRKAAIFLLVLFCLLTAVSAPLAGPVVIDAGMSPNQTVWAFDRNVYGADKEVKFWLRVQRQVNLSRFGTFDYYFKIQVLRPDGSESWNTIYGFNEEGYANKDSPSRFSFTSAAPTSHHYPSAHGKSERQLWKRIPKKKSS